MKTLKISLVVIVLAAIATGIFYGRQRIDPPPIINPNKNLFTNKIEEQIEQLKAKPDNKFCKDYYNEVAYHINEFYKPAPPNYPYGRFGDTQSENDKTKKNLESNLYSAYTAKFIKQAKYVFRHSEWKQENLKFIQEEKNELKRSKFLVPGSNVDKEFSDIQIVLNKYNEIVSFISSCKNFSYSGTAISDRFPITEVQNKNKYATNLLKNKLDHILVNNCARLHNDLKEIPQILFRAHVRYLDNKISHWSNMYSHFNSQSDYANNLYRPLKAEIYELDIEIYSKFSNFTSEFNRLLRKLEFDSQNAYTYFR